MWLQTDIRNPNYPSITYVNRDTVLNQRKVCGFSQFHTAKQNHGCHINVQGATFMYSIFLHTSAESSLVIQTLSRNKPAKNTPVRVKLSKLPARTIEGNNHVDG